MAVYSRINKKELSGFLNNYKIGSLKQYQGILEGIENTNYKITTSSKKKFILTIFEKRVKINELPFFINLKKYLIKKKFLCPNPIANKNGKIINKINGKSCVLISYLEGKQTKKVSKKHCKQVGDFLSSLHNKTKNFNEIRKNSLNNTQWKKIFLKCQLSYKKKYKKFSPLIDQELAFLKKRWPKNLPSGIIHADVFKDNVFFKKNKFSGLIDFYFACNDFLAYDIALTVNAWCFKKNGNFDKEKFKTLIIGYEKNRRLTKKEKKLLNILLRGAAIRILLTRIHDEIFHSNGAFVKRKDPLEYLSILQFHQKINVANYLK